MRSLKERKFFKCTMAADKEGGLTQRGESLGRGGEFKDWLLMVVRHCSHAGIGWQGVRCSGFGDLLDNC